MKQLGLIAALIGGLIVAPLTVECRAAAMMAQPGVVISELQTGTSASASQEFIELYNPGDSPVGLSSWTIEYKSATSQDVTTSWSKRATLAGSITAHGFYLIAPKSFLPSADTDWSATLAGSAGVVRLKNDSGGVVDTLGYGATAIGAETAPADAPAAGQSVERLPGRLQELSGNGVDTDNNSADFIVRTLPGPQSTASAIELAGTESPSDGEAPAAPVDTGTTTTDSPTPIAYAPIEITEVLPNPMAPQTDSNDEYIELYNPTADDVNLKGYTLKTGSNFHDYYVLPDVTINAASYVALYARQTKLAMPNNGGAVELLDPAGFVSDQTPPYEAAPDGQAWAYFDEDWAWTLQLTPGQPNILASLSASTATAKVAKPKAAPAPKKAAPAAKKPKAAVKKATKKPKVSKPKTTKTKAVIAAERSLQPARWLIIVLAALTISYAIYEFRHDIVNYYYKLRGYAPVGQAPQSTPERGRDD